MLEIDVATNADVEKYIDRYIRTPNEMMLLERKVEIEAKINRIPAINAEILELHHDQFMARIKLRNDEHENVGLYKKRIEKLLDEKRYLLINNGYPSNYLDEIYTCEKCRDKGYIDGTAQCECFKHIKAKLMLEKTKSDSKMKNSFDDYTETYYTSEEQARAFAEKFRAFKTYVEKFDEKASELNILMYGPVGMGKTFFASCIGRALVSKGYLVVFITSQTLVDVLFTSIAKESELDDRARATKIFEALKVVDFLIIDDFGNENYSDFVEKKYLDLLDYRISGRKRTLYTTNLSFDEMYKKFSQAIFSRINFDTYYFDFSVDGLDMRRSITAFNKKKRMGNENN